MDILPPEVWGIILSEVDVRDYTALSIVGKTFSEMARSSILSLTSTEIRKVRSKMVERLSRLKKTVNIVVVSSLLGVGGLPDHLIETTILVQWEKMAVRIPKSSIDSYFVYPFPSSLFFDELCSALSKGDRKDVSKLRISIHSERSSPNGKFFILDRGLSLVWSFGNEPCTRKISEMSELRRKTPNAVIFEGKVCEGSVLHPKVRSLLSKLDLGLLHPERPNDQSNPSFLSQLKMFSTNYAPTTLPYLLRIYMYLVPDVEKGQSIIAEALGLCVTSPSSLFVPDGRVFLFLGEVSTFDIVGLSLPRRVDRKEGEKILLQSSKYGYGEWVHRANGDHIECKRNVSISHCSLLKGWRLSWS